MNIQLKKSAFMPPGGPTLEDVGLLIMASATILPAKKGELLSAINSFALWLHRTPGEIPADPGYVRRSFERLNFGTLGVTRSRYRNVGSLLKQALKTAGVLPSFQKKKVDLNPDWAALRDRIDSRYAKECLGRFSSFCSAQAIAPQDVDDAIVQRFLDALTRENVISRPWVAAQSFVRIWNRLVAQVPGWPQTRLTPLLQRETYTLEWKQLPAELVAEIKTYLDVLGGGDPLHEKAPPRPLKSRSIAKRRYELLQLISGMKHQGVSVEDLHTLADLCDPERVKKALTFFIMRHRKRHGDDSDSATSMIHGIADMIRALAKHYVCAPQTVVAALTKFSSQLKRRQRGMTEKNRKRLAQLDSPIVQRRFLMYPEIEMKKLAKKKSVSRGDAVRFGILLAIQILILAPMRSENVAELDLQMHFVWPPRRRGEIGIVIPRKSVKNAVPLDYKIPVRWAAVFYTYLDRFRPLLAKNGSTALFPNHRSLPKRPDTISKQITKLVQKELGIDWNAHIFRHLAARLYKRAYPHDHEGLRRLLAHLDGETTRRSYEGDDMRPAVDAYDALIESQIGLIPRPPMGRPRR